MNLKFSPWTDPNEPLILLSVAESVIFWNIKSIQNNPLEIKRQETPGRLRVSQRFKSPMKVVSSTETDLMAATENLRLTPHNPWLKKTGSAEKLELLSCVKLLAKSAKRIVHNDDFTRFVTIDNEGNIYHLRLIDEALNDQLTIDFDGNPMRKIQ